MKFTVSVEVSADDIPFLDECRQLVYDTVKKKGGHSDAEMPAWMRSVETWIPRLIGDALPGMVQMLRQLGRDGVVGMAMQMMESASSQN